MVAPSIIIRKHCFKITTHNEALGFTIRTRLNEWVQSELATMLGQALAPFTPSDSYVQLNKIYVDVGTISMYDFENRLFTIIQLALERAMAQQACQPGNESTTQSPQEKQSATIKHTPPGPQQSPEYQQLEAIKMYLSDGVFPWWYHFDGNPHGDLFNNLPEAEHRALLQFLVSAGKTFPPNSMARLVARFFNHCAATSHKVLVIQLSTMVGPPEITNQVAALVHDAAYLEALFQIPSAQMYRVLFTNIIGAQSQPHMLMPSVFEQLFGTYPVTITPAKLKPLSNQVQAALMAGYNRRSAGKLPYPHTSNNLGEVQDGIALTSTADENRKVQTTHPLFQTNGLYINNAGLLLLHPFLQSLFSNLGLLTPANQFIHTDARHKAAVVLYYLQSGTIEYYEWEMALNKIICGLEVAAVLPLGISLSAGEIAECDLLLQTVAGHWQALKGAGVTAIQQTFILRPGKITLQQNHWLVQVERNGFDILIDRLPWGIGTIKLAWLNQLIHTEW